MKECLSKKYRLIAQATIFVLCISSVCIAEVAEFTDEPAFRTAAGEPQHFIDFETYGDGTPVVGAPTIIGDEWLNLGIQFAAVESGADLYVWEHLTKAEYASPTHTLMPSGDRSSYSITFSTPVVSFGGYIVDSEITSTNEKIILKDSNGNILGDFPMPVNPNGTNPPISIEFIGYVSDIPIAEVLIIEDADGEGLSLDNVMYSVSEPAAVEMEWVYISDSGVPGHEGFTGYMSKYETTNAQYCEFLNFALASGDITVSSNIVYGVSGSNSGVDYVGEAYYDLANTGWTYNGATNGGAARITYSGSVFTVDSGFDNHPVTGVSWYGAMAFSDYYGYRLPTAGEWQAVADFDGSYTYGSGTSINNSMANYYGSTHPDGTTVVGAFGTYGYGLADMAGNVHEWTSSISSGSYRDVRGGGWSRSGGYCIVSNWLDGDPSGAGNNSFGFRVVPEPDSGLVAYWSFDDPIDPGHDDSGNGHEGTVYGAEPISGICRGAMRFDGVNDYIQIADDDSLDISNKIAISAWINPSSISSIRMIVAKSKDYAGMSYSLELRDEVLLFMLRDISHFFGIQTFSTGIWYHVAATYDGSRMKLYINGELDNEQAASGTIPITTQELNIGRQADNNLWPFEGLIDEVRIYDRALSEFEIKELATPCEPAEPDIDVSPLSHDFGDVELGTSRTVIVTISNVGSGGLTVSGIALETDFAITSAPAAEIVVEPSQTADVEITYSPTVLGHNSAVLKITSDDPDEPVVEVQLSATGVEIPPPPSEQIANILAFFDTSVNDGILVGDGPGSSAEKRLNALRNMVEAAGSLIDDELSEEACQQLLDVYRRMDGQPKPPDFVKGEAVPELATMIQELMTTLGCE